MKTYLFPNDIESCDYKVFPLELEQDPNIFFHGTASDNIESILLEGFKPSPDLESVSYSKSSALALNYATGGVILAVRFSNLQEPGLLIETSVAYTYIDPSTGKRIEPAIIGVCYIPHT